MSRFITCIMTAGAVMISGITANFLCASYLSAEEAVTGEKTASDAAPSGPTPVPTKKKLNLPKTGVLATVMATSEATAVDMPWGAGDEIGNMESPLLGSVVKREGNWLVTLSNSSKDITLDVNVELAQYNKKGQKVKSDPFSASLGPNAKTQRPISANQGAARVDLLLTGWKQR